MNETPEPRPMTEELAMEFIQKHRVCYERWNEFAIVGGVRTRVGYSLRLCGINEHAEDETDGGGVHPVPGCAICRHTYDDLRRLAEWIIPKEKPPRTRVKIDSFDHAFHIAPKERRNREEIIVTIEILRESEAAAEDAAATEGESRCLQEMRRKLKELGVQEGRVSCDFGKVAPPAEKRAAEIGY